MQQQFELAGKLHQQGKFGEAEKIYRDLLQQDHNHPALNARLASLMVASKRARESLPLFAKAIAGLPSDVQLLQHAANVAAQQGANVYAAKWMKALLSLVPDNLQLASQYVGILIANHQEQDALDLVNSLIKKDPQNAQLLNFKGMALSRLGEGDKAYKFFERALKLSPGQIGIVRNLIIHGKGKKQPLLDQLIPQYEQKLRAGGLNNEAKMNIAYVLSMYFDKSGAEDKSFDYLKFGNDINRSTYQYSHAQTQHLFTLLSNAVDEDLLAELEKLPPIDGGDAPIFILGMPRSGTTLIEQILSSHSKVGAEGELQNLRDCFQTHSDLILSDAPAEQRAKALHAVFANYIKQVREMQAQREGAQPVLFTDKMPYNFMMCGFIAAVMPDAKIIHCQRDAVETCFSIYKQNFSGTHAYSKELVELGSYYNLYEQHMEAVSGQFDGRIYAANYEQMVSDSESQIKALLEFCGLDMESACLMFHKNKRTVRTASIAQVRQPIYKDAVKASKPFEAQLAPLIETLQAKSGRI